jgi:hypothetical protein
MSLIRRKTRVSAKRVAEILGCAAKTVLNGGAGTDELTRIQNGTRQIRFILEEVVSLAERQEKEGARRLNSARKIMARRTSRSAEDSSFTDAREAVVE